MPLQKLQNLPLSTLELPETDNPSSLIPSAIITPHNPFLSPHSKGIKSHVPYVSLLLSPLPHLPIHPHHHIHPPFLHPPKIGESDGGGTLTGGGTSTGGGKSEEEISRGCTSAGGSELAGGGYISPLCCYHCPLPLPVLGNLAGGTN